MRSKGIGIGFVFASLFCGVLFSQDGFSRLSYSLEDASTLIQPVIGESSLPEDWYKDAVFYELFVREFYDSNADGIGDLKGVTEKLDYLESLGIGGIWLLPINANYDDDHGYAVTDYMGLESDYGTLEDLQELIREAHRRGIGIILDLVLNHCSHFHPYFQDALSSKESPYRDWFVWSQSNLYWRQPWSTKPVWHKTLSEDYYFGLFDESMPDFNYWNEAVYSYMKEVLVYWLNLGVDGFRIDAAKHIFENGPKGMSDQEETIAFFHGLRRVVDRYPAKFMIGEVDKADYLGDGENGLNAYFHFGFVGALTKSIYWEDSRYFQERVLFEEGACPAGAFYSNVLGNHDSFLGPRVMSRFKKKIELAKIVASALLTTPGTPFLYYGEEIGMKSSSRYRYDWSLRTPMQWNSQRNGGFSPVKKLARRRVNQDYKKVNVERQLEDPNSLLKHYQALIHLRNKEPTLRRGEIVFLNCGKSLIAFERNYQGETVSVLINILSRKVKVRAGGILEGKILYGEEDVSLKNDFMELAPYATVILSGKLFFEEK